MGLSDQVQFFAATDTGRKRKHNEDNFLVDRELGLFVVADGMGGHAAGEIASAIAVRTVHEVLSGERDMLRDRATRGPHSEVSSKQILSLLDYAIQAASQRIHAEARTDPRKRGMGTTISLLLVVDAYGYVAHVGDSRIYLVRHGTVHQVTEDHTVANELLRLGMVTRDQLDKVPRKNAITRAVGVYQHAEVDTLTLEILPNDEFLLASDGLCGYFDDTGEDMRQYLTDKNGDDVIQSLITFANDRGGKDNITAVLVRLGGGDNSDSVRARRLQLKREMLAAMPLFSRLNERELLRVMQVADVFEYEPGEVVVHEGEHGERMFVALAGKLQVMTANQKVGEIKPGEHFGEMALIRSRPRSATVRAVERSEVITLKRGDFFEIIRTEPHIAVKLLWQFLGVIANRLENTSRDLSKAKGDPKLAAMQPWVDDEPSLDPFVQPVGGINRLSFHPAVPGDLYDPDASIDDAPAHRVEDSPSLDQAPALAQRIRAPSFQDAPAMAERIPGVRGVPAIPGVRGVSAVPGNDFIPKAPKLPAGQEVPLMARTPGQPEALVGEAYAADTPRVHIPDDPVAAADKTGPNRTRTQIMERIQEDEPFDKKKTLPGRSKKRERIRQETLKSARGDGAFDQPISSREETAHTSAASNPGELEPTAPSRPGASTLPDGKLREARNRALDEVRLPLRSDDGEAPHSDQEIDRKKTVAFSRQKDGTDVPEGTGPEKSGHEKSGEKSGHEKSGHEKSGHEKSGQFRPTKRTIPLEPPDALRSELDALRKEFKERLKKSRSARKEKDSD